MPTKIIDSTNKMRDVWYDLYQAHDGHFYIETQLNRSSAVKTRKPVSTKWANRVISMAEANFEAAIDEIREEYARHM